MPEKSNLELAADILIAAMQGSDFPKKDADKTVTYFQTVYQGICSAEEQHHEETDKNSRPILGAAGRV